MMTKQLICGSCDNEVFLVPYFYDHEIIKEKDPTNCCEYYTAKVKAQAVCPICGTMIYETYITELNIKDIEKIVLEKNN